MQNIAFRKTFMIDTLIVMAPGMHIAQSQSLLDLAWQATNCFESKIFEEYCKILLWCISNYFTIENLTLGVVAVARWH